MGAEEFRSDSRGATRREAFTTAREQAFYDHGHAGYTGTIAEKSDAWELTFKTVRGDYSEGEALANAFEAAWYDIYNGHWETEKVKLLLALGHPLGIDRAKLTEAVNIYDDKWGPALAIRTGLNTWAFMGWASS